MSTGTPCSHQCTDKRYCGHKCCKVGTDDQVSPNKKKSSSKSRPPGPCKHQCTDKYLCGHKCCKYGLVSIKSDLSASDSNIQVLVDKTEQAISLIKGIKGNSKETGSEDIYNEMDVSSSDNDEDEDVVRESQLDINIDINRDLETNLDH